MTDLEALFIILVAVYISQCISWIAPHAFTFSRNSRGRWKAGAPEIAFSGWKIKGAIAHPVPFFAGLVVAQTEPIAVTPEAILVTIEGADTADIQRLAIPWTEIKKFSCQSDWVLADGKRIHRAVSGFEARRTAKLLAGWKKNGCSRAAIEKEWKRRLEVGDIEERLKQFEAAAGWVSIFANTLFVVLFVVVPVYIWAGARAIAWVNLLLATVILIATTTFSFRAAYRELYPDEKDARFSETLTVALSPFAAMRVRDTLTRNLLDAFDPLAIALVLLPQKDFERFAARTYRQIVYPLQSAIEAPESFQKEFAWSREMRDRTWTAFLKKHGADLQAFVAPPAPDSEQSRTYCPRCHAQFRLAAGCCSDCLGMELLPLKAPAAKSSVKA